MTERKPTGMRWQSWIDQQIEDARRRGEFDNLPGAGKPIPDLDKPYDELWWCKQLLEREDLSLAPGTLELKRELEEVLPRLWRQPDEKSLRRLVAELNVRIAKANADVTSGPASNIGILNSDRIVKQWREKRSGS